MPPDMPSDREAQDHRQANETLRLSGSTRFDVDSIIAGVLKPGVRFDITNLDVADEHLLDRAMQYIQNQMTGIGLDPGEKAPTLPDPTFLERHSLQLFDIFDSLTARIFSWVPRDLAAEVVIGENFSTNRPKTTEEHLASMRNAIEKHTALLPKEHGPALNITIEKGRPLSAAIAEELYGAPYDKISRPRQLFITSLVTILHQKMGPDGVNPDNLPLGCHIGFDFQNAEAHYTSNPDDPSVTTLDAILEMEALAKAPVKRMNKEQLAEMHSQITEESVSRLRNVTPYDALESLRAMGLWTYPVGGAGRKKFIEEFEGGAYHFQGGKQAFVGAMNDRITETGEKINVDDLSTYRGTAEQNEAFKHAYLDLVVQNGQGARDAKEAARKAKDLERQRIEAEEAEALAEAEAAASRLEAEAAREAAVAAIDNGTRVPTFMANLDALEASMKEAERARKRLENKVDRNPKKAEEAFYTYSSELADIRSELTALEAERDLLNESGGLEHTSLDQTNARLSEVRVSAFEAYNTLEELHKELPQSMMVDGDELLDELERSA